MDKSKIEQIEFKMRNNDLHVQIATVLSLVGEDASEKGWSKRHAKVLKSLIDDLMFVHENYKAVFSKKSRQ